MKKQNYAAQDESVTKDNKGLFKIVIFLPQVSKIMKLNTGQET